jgi:hypothetical protein
MKKLLATFLSAIIFTFYIQGQNIYVSSQDIVQGEKFIEAYFTPMSESFGVGLNNGWYNTAKPHALGGFDVVFTINTVIIPNSAKTFNIEDAGESTFISASNTTEASSIFGSSNGTQMEYIEGGGSTASPSIEVPFEMPGGFNTSIMPIPVIQAGIGLIKNTAIDLRYMPMLNVGDDINVNLFGVGLKHDLLQWIPAIGDIIPMSLSLQWGYTNLNSEIEIANQEVTLNTQANTINLIASKKLLMLTGYAGIGYNSVTTTFAADPNFELNGIIFNEEINFTFASNDNLRGNIGLRLNLAVVTIQADYTFAEYPTATIGLGVSLR